MSSGWQIGRVDLPKAPDRIMIKMPTSSRKIPVMFEAPWVMSMGPDTKQLSFEGAIFESTKSLPTLYDDYCKPIKRYVEQGQVIDELLLDEAPRSYWQSDGNAGMVCKNTGDDVVRLDESLYIQFASDNGNIYRDYTSNKDFSDKNFISLWVKGTGNEKFKITFYNEVFSGKTNGYRFYAQCSGSAWKQTFIAISSADNTSYIQNTVGTPTGWDKIRSIVMVPSNFNPGSQGYRIDVMGAGQGWKFDGPGDRYDGIYAVTNFQVEEEGGRTRRFRFRLDLTDKTQYFGKV